MSVKTISKNIAYLAVSEIVSKLMLFFIITYAARSLEKVYFGKFSFAMSFSLIAILFADFGINTLLIREISRDKGSVNKLFFNGLIIKAVLSILTAAGAYTILKLLGYDLFTIKIVLIILASTIVSSFTQLTYSIFRSFERMEIDSSIKILRSIFLILPASYVLYQGLGVVLFCAVFIVAELFSLVIALCFIFKDFVKFDFKTNLNSMKNLLMKALPFGLALVFGTIYFHIDGVMLSKIKGDIAVANYSAAYNLVIALLFIPTAYTNAIFPALSRFFKISKEKLILVYKTSFKYMYIIGLPISLGLFFLSNKIIVLFYTELFLDSVKALQILSLFVFIKFVNFLTGIVLSSIDKQKDRMVSQGSTALFNVVFNLILIPSLGIIGAAIATLMTEIFLFFFYYHFVSKHLHSLNLMRIITKPLIAVMIMAAYIYYFDLNIFLTVPIAAGVYLAALYILKVFDKKDKELFYKILKND